MVTFIHVFPSFEYAIEYGPFPTDTKVDILLPQHTSYPIVNGVVGFCPSLSEYIAVDHFRPLLEENDIGPTEIVEPTV